METHQKREMVDYSGFSLKKLNDPRFSHIKLIGGWLVYFTLFFLTEKLIPYESCHTVHSVVDDWIPFCEIFVLPYVMWFFLVAGSLLYYLLYDTENFRNLQLFIMITQAIGILTYILWPSIQDLRPAVMPRQNLFTWGISLIYAFDTPTGVCPSLHVAYSLGIVSVFLKDKKVSGGFKIFVVHAVVIICLATMFTKQHSFIDVIAALPTALLAEFLVFGKKYWLPKLKKEERRWIVNMQEKSGSV